MSMERMFSIICDKCGHNGEDEGLYGHYSSDVRNQARADGWKIGNKDSCPSCVEGETPLHP